MDMGLDSNLLILCDIDRKDFSDWKKATQGTLIGLEKWVELPSFQRILLIFDSPAEAQNALEKLRADFPELYVFFGPNMPLDAKPLYLSLPDAGRLWFTSPPASPPGEWEQRVEDPPNKDLHHNNEFNQQLNMALLKYQAELEGTQGSEETEVCVLHAGSDTIPRLQVELDGGPSQGISLPRTSMPP